MKFTAAVITVSDKCSTGERKDTSGPALKAMLEGAGYDVIYENVVPDELNEISAELIKCSDKIKAALVLTTGGTGFSPRDITPEATLCVLERQTPGLPEAMRAESMKITPRGCLSRGVAGIRNRSLIINLPGSERAAKENFESIIGPVKHGLEMLYSEGSANCAEADLKVVKGGAGDGSKTDGAKAGNSTKSGNKTGGSNESGAKSEPKGKTVETIPFPIKEVVPSMDQWLEEAKGFECADKIGMYLTHVGTVRATSKAEARGLLKEGETAKPVSAMRFSYDPNAVTTALQATNQMPGVYHIRLWLNRGILEVGDHLMHILIGADTRPHAMEAMEFLLGEIKSKCVTEEEL